MNSPFLIENLQSMNSIFLSYIISVDVITKFNE